MAESNKNKYISPSRLSLFLENLKTIFSPLVHKHTISEIEDYTVDSELSSTSVNPVQNKVLDAEFRAIATAMEALEYAIDNKEINNISGVVKYDTVQELTDEEQAQARENIGITDISSDVYKTYMDEYVYEWDGTTVDRDSFALGSCVYYKVSDEIPNLYWDNVLVLSYMSDGSEFASSTLQDGNYCYMMCNAIIVKRAGECTISSTAFTASSTGIYFPRNGSIYMTKLRGFLSEAKDILLRGTDGVDYSIGIHGSVDSVVIKNEVGESATLINKDMLKNELKRKIDTPDTAEVGQILAVKSIDNDTIEVKAIDSISIDADLSTKGLAADAKVTGDRLATVESQIADLLYSPIAISSFTNNIDTAEIGSTVASVILNWKSNKTPTTLMLDGSSIDTALTSIAYDNLSITSNKTWTLKATDERNAKSEKTTKITFVNGVYYGAINSNTEINSDTIIGLTKKLQGSKSITFTTTANEGQYIIFALPKSYGTPAFNVGGFDGGFSLSTTFNFENSSGYTESYCVWLSDNANLGTTTVKVN